MSNLLKTIKTQQLESRKTKNKERATLLTTILGEIERSPKRIESDKDVQAAIQSFVNGVRKKINKKPYTGMDHDLADLNVIEEEFLPRKLSQDETKALIDSMEQKDIKSVMPQLTSYEKEHGVIIDKAYARSLL